MSTLLGVGIYTMDSDLVEFFLPVRLVVPAFLLISAGLATLRIRRHPEPVLVGLLAAVVVFAGIVYVREFQAYHEVDVAFESEGTTMAGTLYLPRESQLHPGVVIAQGSIRAPRRLYHMWADRLVREGVAVLSFDKRGTGASGGDYEADNNSSRENLALLASDVAAAVETLRSRPEVDSNRVGILGLSMGGWLGPLAAERTGGLAFMVLVSGPPVSVGEEIAYSEWTGEGHRDGIAQAEADRLVAELAPSNYDPRPLLRRLEVPTLWVFGEQDLSIPVAKSTTVLDSMRSVHDRPFAYVVYPDAGHLGFTERWPFDLAPGLLDAITGWVVRPEQR